MEKVPVEVSFVLLVAEEQKEAFDKLRFNQGMVQMRTLNGNIHNVEIADFDVMDGEDYILEVDEDARPSFDLRGEVNSMNDLAI